MGAGGDVGVDLAKLAQALASVDKAGEGGRQGGSGRGALAHLILRAPSSSLAGRNHVRRTFC